MKYTIAFLLFLIKFCDSNDFRCVHLTDNIESVEFYCKNFNETLPENCSTTNFYSIGNLDKSKVKRLKIGGCDENKIRQIIGDFRNIRSLDISCSDLKSLSLFNATFQHLEIFNASHNQITVDPYDIWKKMPHVMDVDFSHNKLMQLLGLPQSITKIDLSNNYLQFVFSYDPIYLPNLKSIDLSHNNLKRIFHAKIFSNSKNFKSIRLECNRFEHFDGRFHQLLERGIVLHFSWQNITHFEIEKSIGKPIRVVLNSQAEGIFPSSDGNYTEFHCREGSFENIISFQIKGNLIENPSEVFRCLTPSLETITLIGNFTEKLSSSLLEPFTSLFRLTINGAQSMEFDLDSIKNPSRVYTLDIAGNNLKEIKNVSLLKQFQMIIDFNVAENRMKNVQDLIQYFKSGTILSRLSLTRNHLGKLDVTTFEHLDLHELYLRNTNLSFDDLGPFEPIQRLTRLDISYNNLENTHFSVPSSAFKDLVYFSAAHCNIANASELIKLFGPPISSLDLSGNNVGTLDATTFENFVSLEILNLSKTNLIEIDFGIFKRSPSLHVVDLSYNRLQLVYASSPVACLSTLHLEENEITEVKPFTPLNFPKLWKLAISKNRIQCIALADLQLNWSHLNFIDNPFKQKHGDCSSVVRLINDLGFIGNLISKWF